MATYTTNAMDEIMYGLRILSGDTMATKLNDDIGRLFQKKGIHHIFYRSWAILISTLPRWKGTDEHGYIVSRKQWSTLSMVWDRESSLLRRCAPFYKELWS